MQVSFYGAAREVTGSCYLVETAQTRVLVDCGMFQGTAFADAKNFRDFDFKPADIDAVIVTHAHLDHVGRLPRLAKYGFNGTIYSTPPTAELAHLVLDDAEQIMQDDFRREYRPMLYEREDVDKVVSLFEGVDYAQRVKIGDMSFRFRDAGHIMGSAFVELEAEGKKICFSGDLGNMPDPILKPTAQMGECDYLIIESTYGNRLHEEMDTRELSLKTAITRTVKANGVLVIPAFAIERTQLLLFELNHLVENRLVPAVDVYLDSPLAIKTSEVMCEFPQYYNQKSLSQVKCGEDLFDFPGLHKSLTRDESKLINEAPRPKVIIAGSGMMNGGRIQHHLVRYLSDKRSTVLIIGYQAQGTLGRRLYTGDKRVECLGERIEVKADIMSIGSYSAHADQRQLLEWVHGATKLPGKILCTHGEEDASAALATRLTEIFHLPTEVPRYGERIII
ncbi:MAG: MBL fold metallo-hydrolase [Patescibacteria group bacterium]